MKSLSDTTEDFSGIIRPKDIFKEVRDHHILNFSTFHFDLVASIYDYIVKLFNGEYAGYLRCDTDYHNSPHPGMLSWKWPAHTRRFCEPLPRHREGSHLGLISAIMHDTGYIKATDEGGGTGGKFTLIHIDRSISFAKNI